MKKAHFLLFIFISVIGFSQSNFTVSGKVIDSASREPLAFASVFCQNTTQGTATNKEGSFYLSLKEGGYDLVITYTGYRSQMIRISQDMKTTDLEIEMVKEEKSIEEVVIRSSNEVKDGWKKYGKFFLENFIGTTPFASQTVLVNPEVLKFYYFRKIRKIKSTGRFTFDHFKQCTWDIISGIISIHSCLCTKLIYAVTGVLDFMKKKRQLKIVSSFGKRIVKRHISEAVFILCIVILIAH